MTVQQAKSKTLKAHLLPIQSTTTTAFILLHSLSEYPNAPHLDQ